MFEQVFFNRVLFRLCGVILAIFSISVIGHWQETFVGIALLLLSIYLVLVGWRILKKSNVVYFLCLTVLAFSMVYTSGVTPALLITLFIFMGGMYYVHYSLLEED